MGQKNGLAGGRAACGVIITSALLGSAVVPSPAAAGEPRRSWAVSLFPARIHRHRGPEGPHLELARYGAFNGNVYKVSRRLYDPHPPGAGLRSWYKNVAAPHLHCVSEGVLGRAGALGLIGAAAGFCIDVFQASTGGGFTLAYTQVYATMMGFAGTLLGAAELKMNSSLAREEMTKAPLARAKKGASCFVQYTFGKGKPQILP